jgi:hypothetical protein
MTDLIEQFTGGQVRPELEPGERPFSFDGEIGIEWPAGKGKAFPGWRLAPYNADGPVNTILEFTLHARADDIVWAEATMFADENGRPVYNVPHGAKLHLGEDGKPATGTFRFRVTEVRTTDLIEKIARLQMLLNDPPGPINRP